ncbi:uncharacterized protein LOC107272280 isoform X2 [Cephus cinctus]|uniref:Uncharacterized protein LOC107272280 isoform X2 n=1 Tax=Cephus cinctus TaxID=211228 RepID=A0AAJ7RRR4_CEPCN|nr:uncharacterized protein LOC107272280 isoform X2 [Cephus cinctus]
MDNTGAPRLKEIERSRSNSPRERIRNKERKSKRSTSKGKDISTLGMAFKILLLISYSYMMDEITIYQVFSERRISVPITPQMIYDSIKQLQTRRLYVDFSLIVEHLCRYYPIENDKRILVVELKEKLDCAVLAGLISKCGVDKYCLSNLREQANAHKTALSVFWEKYYQNEMLPLRKKRNTMHSPRVSPNNESDFSNSDSSSH